MAMMVSHELPWPLKQCLSRQCGHAFTEVRRGPPTSVPLTLHLQCFGSSCSPHSLQFSLSHAHVLKKGVIFLGQKPERKSGNISWLLLQYHCTPEPKSNHKISQQSQPLPPNPKDDKGAAFQYYPKSERDQHLFMSLAISLLLCSTSASTEQSLTKFDPAKHFLSAMAPLSNI